jgi:hypothetical protein
MATLAKSGKRVGRPPTAPEPRKPEPHERPEYADRLQVIVDALEIGDLPDDARLYLQAVLRRCDVLRDIGAKRFPNTGEEKITLLLRTVAESTNGPAALTAPILRAVSSCMEPAWVDLGLAWIEAFDAINLWELQEQIRALDFCDEQEIPTHLREAIRRRLRQRFGPGSQS